MTWTPGPWTLDDIWPDVRAGVYEVCSGIAGPVDPVNGTVANDVDERANARLISLAPEMAELLDLMVTHANSNPEWPYVEEAMSLLARARGEDAHDRAAR
jgi:hypothetical protein